MWKKKKNNKLYKMTTLKLVHLEIILHYITYKLFNCKGHIQITSNHSNVNVETKKNNRMNKMTTLNSIHLEIILHYITLTYRHIQTHEGKLER